MTKRLKIKRHVKVWLKRMGYGEQDFKPCEVRATGCQLEAVDVAHIIHSGLGGRRRKERDHADLLVGCCRSCHSKHHSGEITSEALLEIVKRRNASKAK